MLCLQGIVGNIRESGRSRIVAESDILQIKLPLQKNCSYGLGGGGNRWTLEGGGGCQVTTFRRVGCWLIHTAKAKQELITGFTETMKTGFIGDFTMLRFKNFVKGLPPV